MSEYKDNTVNLPEDRPLTELERETIELFMLLDTDSRKELLTLVRTMLDE